MFNVSVPSFNYENIFFKVIRSCRKGYFACGNGQCVPEGKVCDRNSSCFNLQDEKDCNCSIDEFRRETSGLCISADLRCDRDPGCPDVSDEMGCGKCYQTLRELVWYKNVAF